MSTHFVARLSILMTLIVCIVGVALTVAARVVGAALPNGEIIAYSPLIDRQTRTLRLLDLRTDQRAQAATFPDLGSVVIGWSPDGRYYACWSEVTNAVYWVDLRTGRVGSIDDVQDQSPTWSPDGRSLLFYDILSAPARVDIATVDVADGMRYPLTQSDANDFDPVWSPDGQQIAFISYASMGDGDVYIMNADGSDPRRLTMLDTEIFHPAWSPDGRRLLFFAGPDGLTGKLYVVEADGSDLRQLGPNQVFGADWSPDSQHLTYRALDNGIISSYEADLSGNALPLFPANAHFGVAFWSPSGRRLAFASDMGGAWGIFVASADRPDARGIYFDPYAFRTIDWSPDDTRLVFDSPMESDPDFTIASADGSWLRKIDSGGLLPHPQWQP
jgi:TolB protein